MSAEKWSRAEGDGVGGLCLLSEIDEHGSDPVSEIRTNVTRRPFNARRQCRDVPLDSNTRALVVIPTISRRNHSKSNSAHELE